MNGRRNSIGCRHDPRADQALAEFVVGLLAILVVMMGMLQIQRLAHFHTQTLIAARAQAGQDALQTPYVIRYNQPTWISDRDAGNDQIQYTQDDTSKAGNPNNVAQGIIARAHPADIQTFLQQYVPSEPANELSAASSSAALLTGLFLTHGQNKSPPLDIFPVIRSLVYRADSIQMQSDAWMTWAHIDSIK